MFHKLPERVPEAESGYGGGTFTTTGAVLHFVPGIGKGIGRIRYKPSGPLQLKAEQLFRPGFTFTGSS